MTSVAPEASGHYLRALLGVSLTDEQVAVATHPLAPQLVVAGAGSGKTAVMAARVVHLVAHHGIEPSRILGLTFTNKAANELSERVRRSLRALALSGEPASDDDLPTVSTYHAYAGSVVRDHALRIGREPSLQLLTEATQWQLAVRAVRRARGPFDYLNWTPSTVAQRVLSLDSELAEHLVTVAQVRDYDARLIAEVAAAVKPVAAVTDCAQAAREREELLTLIEAYRALKVELDLVDFGDQVALAAEIAASPEVATIERERFAVVVLDEYQDTGVAQRLLLQRLFGEGHPVTAVGDPNQAIYGWRGASVGNLLNFFDHFSASGDAQPLMTSFRCGGRILDVANAAAAPLQASALERGRTWLDVRPLSSTPDRAAAGEVVVAVHSDALAEARWVTAQVRAAHDAGTPWGEIALLCRRRTDFALLHRTMVDDDVPAEVVGLGGLLQMPEVADVVATLRVLIDPVANPSVVRLLTGPRWRVGPRDLAALGHRAHRLTLVQAHDDDRAEQAAERPSSSPLVRATQSVDPVDVVSLMDAVESPGPPVLYSSEALARFAGFRDEIRALRPLVSQPIVEAVATVLRRTGLAVEIESDSAALAAARAANLATFLDHAAHFTGLDGESDLRSFLAYLVAAADEEDGLDVGGVSSADTVKLMTVHKAKGLEWDVVVLPGMSVGVFPSARGRSRWTKAAHVLPYSLRGDAADLPRDPALTSAGLKLFGADCKVDDLDEERRLLYVALTRARHRLVASGSWWSGTRATPQGPSTFLAELHAHPQTHEDVWVTEENAPVENPLLAAAREDVAWPRPYDVDVLARRRSAAAAVLAARDADPSVTRPQLLGEDARLADRWAEESAMLLAELRRQRALDRVVPLPRRLTASQIVALGHDPGELARMLARPIPAAPVRQARRGTRFHAWVEALFGDRPLLEPDDLPGSGDEALIDEDLAALQEKFLASEWGARRPHAVEAPFELVVGGRLVRGRIDAVYRTDTGFDVIDYKTGAVPDDFAAAALQLSVYRLAWAGLTGVDAAVVQAGFLYVRTGELRRPDRLHSLDELAEVLAGGPPASEQVALF